MAKINIRLAVQQRVLPAYRVPFFDALAQECSQGLSLFAGQPARNESIENIAFPVVANFQKTRNIHLLGGKLYLCWQLGIINWLEQIQPGALIMEANPRYLSSYFAIQWMKNRHLPVIGWGLGSPRMRGALAGLRGKIRNQFISHFDALITYSQLGAKEYQALGFPVQKIFVASNAVAARPTSPPPQRMQNHFAERPVVLFVGRLQARKKVDNLIRACAALPAELQPILQVVGDGPQRAALEALAGQIYPAASFTGALHGRALDQQFTRADLFVLPGSGGLAVQQAMAFALPIIVGQADGTQLDLVRAENGWRLESGGVDVLILIMKNILSDVPRLRRMGLASYRIVHDEINLENMVSRFMEAVNSVVEKK